MVPLPGVLLMAFSLVLRVLRSVVQGVAKVRDGFSEENWVTRRDNEQTFRQSLDLAKSY